jgi:rod shape-determining protein MreC
VSRDASRVLLLTDVDSRLPVLVNSTNARAILSGDGGDAPKLQYLRGHDPIHKGDILLTSGDGGLYPRGLPVGVAEKDLFGQWRVKLYSDRSAIDYVRIMRFTDFSQLVDEAALTSHGAPPVTPAEKAQIEAAVALRNVAPKPDAAKPNVGDAKPEATKPELKKLEAKKPDARKPAGARSAPARKASGAPQ